MEIAVLADIHGNRWALEAVLADIARRGVAEIIDLGDSLMGPFEPLGPAEILLSLQIPSIRGNGDRTILEEGEASGSASCRFASQVLARRHLDWLASLPPTRVIPGDILLCHGTPASDSACLLEEPTETGAVLRPTAEIQRELAGYQQRLVLCAHSHLPRVVALPNGQVVVNPGSVGVPAYADDAPPHKMETGSPHARYATITGSPGGWQISLHSVPYDWEAAAQAAEKIAGTTYASWVRTGRA